MFQEKKIVENLSKLKSIFNFILFGKSKSYIQIFLFLIILLNNLFKTLKE